jgi:peroxiredoxin
LSIAECRLKERRQIPFLSIVNRQSQIDNRQSTIGNPPHAIIMEAQAMSKSNAVKVLVLLLILGVAVFLALRLRQPRPVDIGERAPDFTLAALTQGPLSLHDFGRRVVVLNFWATWCPPCVEETPSLEKFAEQMRLQSVTVIGVSVDQDLTALQTFVAQQHLSFPILRDPDQSVAHHYGTFKFPETYIIDQDGKVAEKLIGAVDWQDPRLLAFVQELAGKAAGSRQ